MIDGQESVINDIQDPLNAFMKPMICAIFYQDARSVSDFKWKDRVNLFYFRSVMSGGIF